MEILWISYRNPVETLWNPHSIPMEIQLKFYGIQKDFLWKPHKFPIEILWNTQRIPMEIP